MLDPVAELRQDRIRYVPRTLRDEENANALGANEPNDLLDLVEKRVARVLEQQVRLVEEERELRLVHVADFGQLVEQRRQHPQHERREQRRPLLHVLQFENADETTAIPFDLEQVIEVE